MAILKKHEDILSNLEPYRASKENESIFLIVNSGSSSLKLSIFQGSDLNRLLDAHINDLQSIDLSLKIRSKKGQKILSISKCDHHEELIKESIQGIMQEVGPLTLAGIGHRFVHGGRNYTSSVLIEKSVLKQLQELSELAPLHNQACLDGIRAAFSLFKEVPEFVCFDTAFSSGMPKVASEYAIPKELGLRYSIKRFGFHGLSHHFLWNIYKDNIAKKPEAKVITLHLGNGCSVDAILDGNCLDTSMGFTPLEGLIMSTRSGDIDPAIVEFLCDHEKKTPLEILELLNTKSGVLGISGISSNMKILVDLMKDNADAELAVDMFCYKIKKYIFAYLAVLQGCDALIFSGGIGEHSSQIREMILDGLSWYGVEIDHQKNRDATHLLPGQFEKISGPRSKIEVYVIATDENLFIAKEVLKKLP